MPVQNRVVGFVDGCRIVGENSSGEIKARTAPGGRVEAPKSTPRTLRTHVVTNPSIPQCQDTYQRSAEESGCQKSR
jgi:hypothetical protein